jgi:hypothetical protein
LVEVNGQRKLKAGEGGSKRDRRRAHSTPVAGGPRRGSLPSLIGGPRALVPTLPSLEEMDPAVEDVPSISTTRWPPRQRTSHPLLIGSQPWTRRRSRLWRVGGHDGRSP